MMIEFSVIGVTTIFLIIGSYFDLRDGEIPDKVSMGLILTILTYALVYSIYRINIEFFGNALLLGAGYFVLSYVLFYLGEWGGGDVKLMTGIGCALGFLDASAYFRNSGIFPYYVDYLINVAIISAPYLLIYSMILGIMKRDVFSEFIRYMKTKTTLLLIIVSFIPITLSLWIRAGLGITMIYALVPFLVILSLYLKAVEHRALQKTILVSDLKEGDVVAEDLVIDGNKIASKRDIEGLTNKEIDKINKLAASNKIPERIRIKWGIKFAPILLLAFIVSILFGDLLETFVIFLLDNEEVNTLIYPF